MSTIDAREGERLATALDERFEDTLREDERLGGFFARLAAIGGRAVVFGGWARDHIASGLFGREILPADVDAVVERIGRRQLAEILPDDHHVNAFGGFVSHAFNRKLDIWCIEDTYTLSVRNLPFEVERLPATTVFTIESIVFKPSRFYGRCSIIEHRFLETLRRRCIDFQGGEIRFPPFQAARVLHYAIKLDFKLSGEVSRFVRSVLREPGNRVRVEEFLAEMTSASDGVDERRLLDELAAKSG